MRNHLTSTATITRTASTGGTGVTVVVTDTKASEPFPAARMQWEMATYFEGFEMFIEGNVAVQIGDVVNSNAQLFTVKEMRTWPKSRMYPNGQHALLLARRVR